MQALSVSELVKAESSAENGAEHEASESLMDVNVEVEGFRSLASEEVGQR